MGCNYKDLGLTAYIFALEELRIDGKMLSIDDVVEALKERVSKRIIDNIDFELSSEDFARINNGIKDAIIDYLFPRKGE